MLQLLLRQCGQLWDHGLIRQLKRKLKFTVVISLPSYLSWLTVRTCLHFWEAPVAAQEDVRMQMLALGMKAATRTVSLLMNLQRHLISLVLPLLLWELFDNMLSHSHMVVLDGALFAKNTLIQLQKHSCVDETLASTFKRRSGWVAIRCYFQNGCTTQ